MKKILSAGLLLLTTLLLALGGCNATREQTSDSATTAAVEESSDATPQEGVSKKFTFAVIHGDGGEKIFTIETSEENLGAALLAEGLVVGSESSMGLFVTEVDGETGDESQQQWWCLTKDGEMWSHGVSDSPIEDGDRYEFTLTTGY